MLTHWGWDKSAANFLTFSSAFLLNENMWISIKISLKLVHTDPINNISSLVQIMAWRRPDNKPLSEPTRTTRMFVFREYLQLPHDNPYYWFISDPKSKQDKIKVTNLKNLAKIKISKFCTKLYMQHTFWSCFIRCIHMKWIPLVLWKLQSGHDSVHRRTDRQTDGRTDRWTDGQHETSIPLFNFIEVGGIMMVNLLMYICITQPPWVKFYVMLRWQPNISLLVEGHQPQLCHDTWMTNIDNTSTKSSPDCISPEMQQEKYPSALYIFISFCLFLTTVITTLFLKTPTWDCNKYREASHL